MCIISNTSPCLPPCKYKTTKALQFTIQNIVVCQQPSRDSANMNFKYLDYKRSLVSCAYNVTYCTYYVHSIDTMQNLILIIHRSARCAEEI